MYAEMCKPIEMDRIGKHRYHELLYILYIVRQLQYIKSPRVNGNVSITIRIHLTHMCCLLNILYKVKSFFFFQKEM